MTYLPFLIAMNQIACSHFKMQVLFSTTKQFLYHFILIKANNISMNDNIYWFVIFQTTYESFIQASYSFNSFFTSNIILDKYDDSYRYWLPTPASRSTHIDTLATGRLIFVSCNATNRYFGGLNPNIRSWLSYKVQTLWYSYRSTISYTQKYSD